MQKKMSVVVEMQLETADSSISVSSLLRKAKIVATKLGLQDFLKWLDMELNGYIGVESDQIPEYRQLHGELKAFNPYHGWQPILFEHASMREYYSSAPINQAIGPLEEMVTAHKKDNKSGSLVFAFSPEKKQSLIDRLDLPMDVSLFLSVSSVHGILDAVRNSLLDWTLKLETAGITGDGLVFSAEEKHQAIPVTQNFFAQNIGHIGNAYDHATVVNSQTAHKGVDVARISAVIDEIERSVHLIPIDKKEIISQYLKETRLQISQSEDKRNEAKITAILKSIKTVCEGIAGNVVAQGIISLLQGLI